MPVPALNDVMADLDGIGANAQQSHDALMEWRTQALDHVRSETAGDPQQYMTAVSDVDRVVAQSLSTRRTAAVANWARETFTSREEAQQFIGDYIKADGDPSAMGNDPRAEALKAFETDPLYSMPKRDERWLPIMEPGGNEVARAKAAHRPDGTTDIAIAYDTEEPVSKGLPFVYAPQPIEMVKERKTSLLSIPTVSETDVLKAYEDADAKTKTLQQRIDETTAELGNAINSGVTDNDTPDNEVAQLRATRSALMVELDAQQREAESLRTDGRAMLQQQAIAKAIREHPELSRVVGARNLGEDYVRGLAGFFGPMRVAWNDITGDTQERDQWIQYMNDLPQLLPGSTGRRFMGGAQALASDVAEGLGGVTPQAVAGLVAGAGKGAVWAIGKSMTEGEVASLATTTSIAALTPMGVSSYGVGLERPYSQADALEARAKEMASDPRHDPAQVQALNTEASRLRGIARFAGITQAATELGSEMIFPEEQLLVKPMRGSWAMRLGEATLKQFGEGAVAESGQQIVANAAFGDGRDLGAVAKSGFLEMTSGLPMTLIGTLHGDHTAEHERLTREAEMLHGRAMEIAGRTTDDQQTRDILQAVDEQRRARIDEQQGKAAAATIMGEANAQSDRAVWMRDADGTHYLRHGDTWLHARRERGAIVPVVDDKGETVQADEATVQRLAARETQIAERSRELDAINAKEAGGEALSESEARRRTELIHEKNQLFFGEPVKITSFTEQRPTDWKASMTSEEAQAYKELESRYASTDEEGRAAIAPRLQAIEQAVKARGSEAKTTPETRAPQNVNPTPEWAAKPADQGPETVATEPPPASTSTPSPQYDGSTLRHADIEAQRVLRNLPPLLRQETQKNAAQIARAIEIKNMTPEQRAEAGVMSAAEVVDDINKKSRPRTTVEGAQILVHMQELRATRDALAARINDSSLTDAERDTAMRQLDSVTVDLTNTEQASRDTASELGRGLQFQRYMRTDNEVKPLEVMLAEWQRIKREQTEGTGKFQNLTDEEVQQVKDLHQMMQQADDARQMIEQAAEELGVETAVENLADEIIQESKPSVDQGAVAEQLDKKLTDIKARLAANRAAREQAPNTPPTLQSPSSAVTPEQDAAYMDAVNRGDTETAQRMVDEAAMAAGYDSETLFRGRQDAGNVVAFGKDGAHFTPDREYAEGYAEGESGNVVNGRAKIDNPLRIDSALVESVSFNDFRNHLVKMGLPLSTPAKLFEWSQNPKYNQTKTIGEAIDAIESDSTWADFQEDPSSSFTDNLGGAIWPLGFDAIRTLEHGNKDLPVVILSDPSQIKSTDPVTRDDAGNVIPLSQRFNPESPDIRQSPASRANDEIQKQSEAKLQELGIPTSGRHWAANTMRGALGKIAGDKTLPATTRLIARVLARLPFNNLLVSIYADGRLPYAGQWVPMRGPNGVLRGEIQLNTRALGQGREPIEVTIVHEVLHHATAWMYENPQTKEAKAAKSDLDALTKRARAVAAAQGITDFDYHLSNAHEFITGLFTNAEFQKFLAGIPNEHKPTLGQRIRTALQEAMRIVARLVTGNEVQPESVLDRAFGAALDLIGEGAGDALPEARAQLRSPDNLQSPAKNAIHPDDEPLYEEMADTILAKSGNAKDAAKVMASEAPEVSAKDIARLLKKSASSAATDKKARAAKGGKVRSTADVMQSMADAQAAGREIDPRHVRQLAKSFIAKGVTGVRDLVAKVKSALQELKPEITDSDVRQLLSNYGKRFQLERTQVDRTLADLRSQARILEHMHRLESSLPLLRTGPEFTKATEELRSLNRQLEGMMADKGYRAEGEGQIKGRMDVVRQTLLNQIEDLNAQIDGREPIPHGRERVEYDQETAKLAALRDRLREKLHAMPHAQAQLQANDIAQGIAAAKASLDEYNRRIAAADFSPKAKRQRATNAELQALQRARDAARTTWLELRAATTEYQAAQQAKAYRRKLETIDELERQLQEGVVKEGENKRPMKATEIKVAEDRIAELRKELADQAYGDGMEALRKWADERRSELQDWLKNGRPAPSGRREKPSNAEAMRIRQEVQDLENLLKAKERPAKVLAAIQERAKRAQERIDQLRAGLYAATPKAKADEVSTPEIDAAEESLNKLLAIEEQLHREDGTRDNAAYRQRVAARTADLEARMARGDYSPRSATKREIALDAESTKARAKLEEVQKRYNEEVLKRKLAARNLAVRTWHTGAEITNTMRAMMTGLDFSAVFRQGAFIVFSDPVLSAKALAPMFKAFASEEGSSAIMQEIDDRPNAPLYAQAKLFFSREGASLAKLEEAYMSRWAAHIPGVSHSERAYRAFLNRVRADAFDKGLAWLQRSGTPTEAEIKALGNFVNVATGRGTFEQFENAAVFLNTVFFAPKFVASRFQLALGQPLWNGSARTRMYIAQQYARFFAGIGLLYGMALTMKRAFGVPDDDDKNMADPTSADFGKIKIGRTYLDPLAGIGQSVVFLGRTAVAGWNQAGMQFGVTPYKEPKFTDRSWSDVAVRFMRSKLAPVPGAAWTFFDGKDLVGNPSTLWQQGLHLAVPMTVNDMAEAIQAEGVPAGVALWLASWFGFGLQSRTSDPNVIEQWVSDHTGLPMHQRRQKAPKVRASGSF